MIKKINIQGATYIELFAGAALMLLMEGYVDNIVINDYDKAIYSIWRAIISEPENFVDRIIETPVNIDEWKKQKEIYTKQNKKVFKNYLKRKLILIYEGWMSKDN